MSSGPAWGSPRHRVCVPAHGKCDPWGFLEMDTALYWLYAIRRGERPRILVVGRVSHLTTEYSTASFACTAPRQRPPGNHQTQAGTTTPPLASPVLDPPTGVSAATVAASQAALDIPQIIDVAQSTFGGNCAGMWVDNSGNPSILHIAVTGSRNITIESSFMNNIPVTATV